MEKFCSNKYIILFPGQIEFDIYKLTFYKFVYCKSARLKISKYIKW